MYRKVFARALAPTFGVAIATWAAMISATLDGPPAAMQLPRTAEPAAGGTPAPSAEATPTAETAAPVAAAAQGGVASVLDGAFTEEQAVRGKALYTRNCGGCHGNSLRGSPGGPAIAGSRFNNHWASGVPVGGLYEFIRTQMPPGKAGSLPPQSYIDIVAYVLSFNGFPAGEAELPTDEDQLFSITIERPAQ